MKTTEHPLIASWGGGRNSTAMLIGMHEYGIRPDAILFADTGGEKPETYDFMFGFGAWLLAVGMPCLTILHKDSMYSSLEDNCLKKNMLPSRAYGFSSCAEKWKHQPQEKWANHWQPAIDCWAKGGKVVKAIGFDTGEAHRAERAPAMNDKYVYYYPLTTYRCRRSRRVSTVRPVPRRR